MTSSSNASTILKRSVVIAGHKTSVSLENEFWTKIKMLAAAKDQSLSSYIGAIDIDRESKNLSSTLRLHVLSEISAERDKFQQIASNNWLRSDRPLALTDRRANER